jgi:hypothetical protein
MTVKVGEIYVTDKGESLTVMSVKGNDFRLHRHKTGVLWPMYLPDFCLSIEQGWVWNLDKLILE